MDATSNTFAALKKIECPFAIKWEIDEDKLVSLKNNTENKLLETKRFNTPNLPGVKFYLRIYPNGYKEERRGKVWIFLYLELGNEKKIKADYKICIDSLGFAKAWNYEFQESLVGPGHHCCDTAELFDSKKKFMANGKFIIKCQGTLCLEKECPSGDNGNKWKEQSFLIKLWNRNDADFTISVGEKSIKAHKSILALRSPIFKTMFNNGMKAENKMDINNFPFETVELALQLLYDRKTSSLKLEEKVDVLQFFDKYEIQDLKDSLEVSLIENISLSSVVNMAKLSIAKNLTNLQERCKDFMVAIFRMDQLVVDFDLLDDAFALKVLKSVHYNIAKS